MTSSRLFRRIPVCAALFFLLGWLVLPSPLLAGGPGLPPDALRALHLIHSGDTAGAISLARSLQKSQPGDPLGFLLETEAIWWNRYCAATEIKYGMIDAWRHSKEPADEAYLALASHVIQLAQAHLSKSDTAEMHVYAGLGWALKARVYGVRGENRDAARAGVAARSEMLRALALDPHNPDATGALGVYNYYVDTLSPLVKFLRFFMGIPGGNKELGVKQMEIGMERGTLLDVDVRFVLARVLRQYDQKYETSLSIALPLVSRYPTNPAFLLLVGNLNVELGRDANARKYFQPVLDLSSSSDPCLARSRDLATSFLDKLSHKWVPSGHGFSHAQKAPEIQGFLTPEVGRRNNRDV